MTDHESNIRSIKKFKTAKSETEVTQDLREQEAGEALLLGASPPERKLSIRLASIQEHLDALSDKAGHQYVRKLCEKHKVTLDSPWPPRFPEVEEKRQKAVVIDFPLLFGEDTRAVSNAIARCPVFAAVRKRQKFDQYVTVGVVVGTKIEFMGEQLNQDDHDVLMQLVKMTEHRPVGTDVWLSVNSVLEGLGRHTRQEQRKQLFAEINRLLNGAFRVTPPHMPMVEFHLIDMAIIPTMQKTKPQYARHLMLRINKDVAKFYQKDAFTLFDVKQRMRLEGRGSELAKALHLWVIGNIKQYPTKVETLQDRLGSRQKDLKEFRRNLRAALDLLKDVGIVTDWKIDEKDLVRVRRTPSKRQKKSLATKGTE
ncbi:TrfA protein [Gammaproteobacteria bacterium]